MNHASKGHADLNVDAIEFDKNPEDTTELLLANLYTLLLMMNIFVKYDDVKCKEEYKLENGTTIKFIR